MSTELLSRDDVRELTEESLQILTQAESFKIATTVSYQLAADELKKIKGAMKRLELVRKAITQPMDTAKQAVMDFFRAPADRLEKAEQKLKSSMLEYSRELERQQQEEQRKVNEAAEAERQALALSAAKAAERGEMSDAQDIATQIATVAPIAVIQRAAPKVAGVNFRDVWKFEVIDLAAVPREYFVLDETKLRKVVQALKEQASIPGVRVYSEKSLAAGAA